MRKKQYTISAQNTIQIMTPFQISMYFIHMQNNTSEGNSYDSIHSFFPKNGISGALTISSITLCDFQVFPNKCCFINEKTDF